ncbi:hypothetical protein ACFL34_03390 [Candidatus Sumerlaeota bacterium]
MNQIIERHSQFRTHLNQLPLRVLSTFLAIMVLCAVCHADEFQLKNGNTVKGTILEETPLHITIKLPSGVKMKLPRAQLSAIKKSSNGGLDLVSGLMSAGKYAEAYITVKDADHLSSPPLRAMMRALLRQWDRDLSASPISPSTRARLMTELARTNTDEVDRIRNSRLLAHSFIALGKQAEDRVRTNDARKNYIKAFQLAPCIEGLLAMVLSITDSSDDTATLYESMRQYISIYDEDIEAIELFAVQYAEKKPWDVLPIIYPDNKRISGATETLAGILPKILLRCFNSPYPTDAPFDRIECYEHYMRFSPNADPTPWVALKIEAKHPLGEPLKRWASWSEKQGNPTGAILAYEASKSLTNIGSHKDSLQRSIDKLIHQRSKEWKGDISNYLGRHDYSSAHHAAMRSLCFNPHDDEVVRLVISVTALQARCRSCTDGRVRCSECEGKGTTLSYRSVIANCGACSATGEISVPVISKTRTVCRLCKGTGKHAGRVDAMREGLGNAGGYAESSMSILDCMSCGGNGGAVHERVVDYTSKVCSGCSGSGKKKRRESVRNICSSCNRLGAVTCPSCDGKPDLILSSPRPAGFPSSLLPAVPNWLLTFSEQSKTIAALVPHYQRKRQRQNVMLTIPNYPVTSPIRKEPPPKTASANNKPQNAIKPLYGKHAFRDSPVPDSAVKKDENWHLKEMLQKANSTTWDTFAKYGNSLETLGMYVLSSVPNDPGVKAVHSEVMAIVGKQSAPRERLTALVEYVDALEENIKTVKSVPGYSQERLSQKYQELAEAKQEAATTAAQSAAIILERDGKILELGHKATDKGYKPYALACFTFVRHSQKTARPVTDNALLGIVRVGSEKAWKEITQSSEPILIPPYGR